MKTLRFSIVIIYLISFLPITTLSQTLKSSTILNDSLVSRKLYLQTDRGQYFLGDTIWYKAYYLDGQSNKFVPGLISMYVDVIDDAGQSVLDQIVPLDNGVADGAIDIQGSLEPGDYIIRAFTDFQKQIGADAFFYKQIQISRLESFVEGAKNPEPAIAQEIDVAFLPEGGMLLEGHMNTVGIKAIDSNGQGLEVQGEIHDSKGEAVVAFNTSYKGMASVRFIPQKHETYHAILPGYPDFNYTFRDIVKEGLKIEFEKETSSDLRFSVVTNAESLLERTYYFVILHHGEEIFYKKFVPKSNTLPITVNRDALPAGINRMVILDEQLLPVSERLFFSTNYQINEIRIKPDKQAYETRNHVRIRLSDDREMDNQSWSNLSMVVVDEFTTSQDDPSTNILSCLLIDSELKGLIESPLDYFEDDPEMASAAKLDLLMITQGWSRYIWSKPEEYMALNTTEEEGFDVTGTVNRVVGNKPATEGTVDLKIYNNDFMHMDVCMIDEQGRFIFKGVSYLDSASVFLQARNKKEKLSFKLSLDPFFNDFPLVSKKYQAKEESFVPKKAEIYQKQYENLQALKEYTLKTGSFYIEEVSITEHRRERDDGHFRIYAKPSNSIKLPDKDLGAVSIFDYIKSHFSGVTVTSSNIVIIGGPNSFSMGSLQEDAASEGFDPPRNTLFNSGAMLLLDGVQVPPDLLESVSMNQIDVVEILKFPHEFGIYGTRAANGVVAVYTKKGVDPDYSNKYIPGTIAKKLKGYSSNREFYTPKYTHENINSERPDHRIVLYWNPNIFTEKGRASVDFFTCDDLSRYHIYVEGITRDGQICLGSASFEVDKRH